MGGHGKGPRWRLRGRFGRIGRMAEGARTGWAAGRERFESEFREGKRGKCRASHAVAGGGGKPARAKSGKSVLTCGGAAGRLPAFSLRCTRGEIGRHVRFRFLCFQRRGGSNPLGCTIFEAPFSSGAFFVPAHLGCFHSRRDSGRHGPSILVPWGRARLRPRRSRVARGSVNPHAIRAPFSLLTTAPSGPVGPLLFRRGRSRALRRQEAGWDLGHDPDARFAGVHLRCLQPCRKSSRKDANGHLSGRGRPPGGPGERDVGERPR